MSNLRGSNGNQVGSKLGSGQIKPNSLIYVVKRIQNRFNKSASFFGCGTNGFLHIFGMETRDTTKG